MKITTRPSRCSWRAQQAITNHGYKPEEYMSNGKRVLAVVNTRTGARITSTDNERTFDDLCKRLHWL